MTTAGCWPSSVISKGPDPVEPSTRLARIVAALAAAPAPLTSFISRRRRPAVDTDRLILETERKALLRLGTLAGTAPIQELFDAMAEELGRIVDIETGETFRDMAGLSRYDADGMMTFVAGWGPKPGWPSPIGSRWPLTLEGDGANSIVYRTGRPARVDGSLPVVGPTSQRLTEILNVRSSVAVPIFVDEVLWGSATIVSDRDKPLPSNTESRMAEFAALASTSIASAQRRAEVQRLADEQAALRRVATLVAAGAEPEQVWESVLSEVGALCQASRAGLIRYEPANSLSIVALWPRDGPYEEMAERWPLTGNGMSARVARERTVVRMEGWTETETEGEIGAAVRHRMSVGTSVMAPVFAGGELWGGVIVHSPVGEVLGPDTEQRVTGFAELVSTALAHANANAEVRRLADEQATISQIATLVAQQAPLGDLCQTVTEDLAALLEVEDVKISRYEGLGNMVIVGSCGELDDLYPVGFTSALYLDTAVGQVYRDGKMVRVDGYEGFTSENARWARDAGVRSTIGCPIFVGDRLWGALTVSSPQPGRLPDRLIQPISDSIDLIATAIRNAEADERLRASRQRIVTATDQARRRFERDLHDGAQQRLVALALDLRGKEHLAGTDLEETANEVDSILTDLRDLSRGIHPAMLSEGGLHAAIRSLIRRCPTPVQLLSPDRWPSLDELTETACYYVVAEALTNVAKHAKAHQVDIELTLANASLRIAVRDDGVGGADTADGSGLIGIADRVDALGGSLSVASPPEVGTTLIATLPIARA
jgi:signal transduction histidine kinase